MNAKQRTRQLEVWDKKYTWHPFTQMKEWCEGPIVVIEKGEGNYLVDTQGRRYLDGVSSLWCNVHGHRVKKIDSAIQSQLKKIAHSTFLGLSHEPAILLSKKLVEIAPKGLTRVFYSDSGSASVEVALKMAYQYWQLKGQRSRKLFLKLNNAYHGDTLGSVSVGGIDLFHEVYGPLTFKTLKIDAPYYYRDKFKGSEGDYAEYCAAKVERILRKQGRKICALVVEPLIQGAAGMLRQPKGYLSRLGKLTKKYNVLLIVDEVATGFGRTGTMFACGQESVSPDFLCIAKGVTGGYLPLSATLTTEGVYDAFLGDYGEFKHFFHGHTYSANPLACAAALANLEIFEKEGTLEQLKPKIRILTEELEKFKRLPHVGDIRQAGFMVGIELVKDTKTKTPYPLAQKVGAMVGLLARKHGVIIRPLGNVVVLMPPLSISESELYKLCRVVYRCIKQITELR
ncbi:MAG: adenosylmethionine--8-amino-7-oxononanoate transaminase [Omnitrophica bacterium RIFCSPHIGHO2_02_FULL_51_18]|nr:MAG: adenosylmethionine--8-amino-7-oxononanoate transaminase [Omnitrophica bacterium RIFCSPHIGHO2_02_FULL_51_18]